MKIWKGIRLMALCLCAALLLGGCAKSTSAKYEDAKKHIIAGEYDKAITAFTEIDGYEDSSKYLTYVKAIRMAENGRYDLAISALEALKDFSDSKLLAVYYQARQYEQNQEYEQADKLYRTIPTFKDSAERIAAIPDMILDRDFAYAKGFLDVYGSYGDMLRLVSKTYSNDADKMKQQIYDAAQERLTNEDFESAYALFQALADVGFSDSDMRAKDTVFAYAKHLMSQDSYQLVLVKLIGLTDYPAAEEPIKECRYQLALQNEQNGLYAEAYATYVDLGDYGDCADRAARLEKDYAAAQALLDAGEYDGAKAAFEALNNYSDAQTKVEEADYHIALILQANGEYERAVNMFKALESYSDSKTQVFVTYYAEGEAKRDAGNYDEAVTAFTNAGSYSDAGTQIYATYYAKGIAKRDAGDYDEAVAAFMNAGSYGDAKTQITETLYQKALSLNATGDYTTAYSIFAAMKGYKDVDTLLSTDENLQAAAAAAAAAAAKAAFEAKWSIGNYVEFGTYPQTETGTDKTPIEWLVLDRDGNKALLISRYGLDAQPYNTSNTRITWEKCTLRTWLNGTFLYKAFTGEEQKGIVLTNVDNSKSQGYYSTNGENNTLDRIFLLSYAEANKYFGVTYSDSNNTKSRVEPTAYAIAQGAWTNSSYKTADGKAAGYWWLRSPGLYLSVAAYVRSDGSLTSSHVNRGSYCVRPALWVNLESDIFQSEYAGSAFAEESNDGFAIGNYITFGVYPQTAEGNDETPIEWLVFDCDGEKALLISRYGLDAQPYNTDWNNITWEQCTLRTWLNGTFLNKAFTSEEQKGIVLTNVDNSKSQGYSGWSTNGGNNTQDKIFLLSYAEANKYFGVTYSDSNNTKSRVEPTAYAIAQGAWTSSSNKTASGQAAGVWWLRSPGNFQGSAALVCPDGSLYSYYVNIDDYCVRPALWVNLESDIFQSGI